MLLTINLKGVKAKFSSMVNEEYGDKILGLDVNGAVLSGRLGALSLAAGYHLGMADAVCWHREG